MQSQDKKLGKKKILTGFLLIALAVSLAGSVFLIPKNAQAFPAEVTTDPVQTVDTVKAGLHNAWEKTSAIRWKAIKGAASKAFKAALSNFLNKIAYDTATWLGQGAKGQKPGFMTGDWDSYISEAGGAAVGGFVEELGAQMGNKEQCLQTCRNESSACFDKNLDDKGMDKCQKEFDDCSTACGSWADPGSSFVADMMNFVCTPSLDIAPEIALDLPMVSRDQPDCTLNDIKDNWSKEIKDFDGEKIATSLFNPKFTDVGVAMYERGALSKTLEKKDEVAKQERGTRQEGVQPTSSKISKAVKAPTDITQRLAQKGIVGITDTLEKIQPHEGIFAQAFNTFTNTLVSTAMKTVIEKGLAALTDAFKDEPDAGDARKIAEGLATQAREGLYLEEASPFYGGTAGAKLAFADLLQAGRQVGGVKNVLGELTICPDKSNPGPNDCVIDSDFAEAASQGLTLLEAINDGWVKGDATFGFDVGGNEPDYDEGYPYRSLVILRKYRVIPVGWEIAALYIRDNHFQKETLDTLMRAYDDTTSPFYGLVDPNWVLILPEVSCQRQGYGFEIQDYQTAGGYDADKNGGFDDVTPTWDELMTYESPGDSPPELYIVRTEDYCADEQSCILEDKDGKCLSYGYCTEEKRTWNINTNKCQDYYNTCQTFNGPTGMVSYLENTIDWDGCNIDNAGCGWYCQDYNPSSDIWTCVRSEEVWQDCTTYNCAAAGSCATVADGCEITEGDDICTIPFGGVECIVPGCSDLPNLIQNPSFELGDLGDAEFWTEAQSTNPQHSHEMQRTNETHDGDYALRSYSLGLEPTLESRSVPISVELDDLSEPHTFSIWVYNNLVQGSIEIELGVFSHTINVNEGKAEWVEVTYEFITGTMINGQEVILRTVGSPSGTVYFDDLEVKKRCADESKLLHIDTEVNEDADIYFDNKVEECDAQFNGCSEVISLAGDTINYLPNGSFEYSDGVVGDGIVDLFPGWQDGSSVMEAIDDELYAGEAAARINTGVATVVQADAHTGEPLDGRTFTLSFRAKDGPLGTCGGEYGIRDSVEGTTEPLESSDDWRGYSNSFSFPDNLSEIDPGPEPVMDLSVYLRINGDCLLDVVMVEEADSYSSFKEYGSVNNAHLKKAPDYLACRGYTSLVARTDYWDEIADVCLAGGATNDQDCCNATEADLTEFYNTEMECTRSGYQWNETLKHCMGYMSWRDDVKRCVMGGFEECLNYTLHCSEEDVGCNLYTPLDYGDPVAGNVVEDDYCPAECISYETYSQTENDFENERYKYFMAGTAQTCSAQSAGCSEFTNLDKLAEGGEAKEYYSYIRQCVETSDTDCTTFYSWEGDDQTGYQIKTYLIEMAVDSDGDGLNDFGPHMTDLEPSTVDCRDYYGLSPDQQGYDPEITPDCQEIYNDAGTLFYRRYSKTITCSDNCHPMRLTALSDSPDEAHRLAANRENCIAHNGVWEDMLPVGGDGVEDVVKDGVVDCIYWAIPQEGISCSAVANGCREYVGNAGNNWQATLTDDFEDGTAMDWYNDVGVDPLMVSTEAITVGDHAIRTEDNPLIMKKINATCYLSSACTETGGCPCDDISWSRAVVDAAVPTNPSQANCWVVEGDDRCTYRTTIEPGKNYLLSFWAKWIDIADDGVLDADGHDIYLYFDDDIAASQIRIVEDQMMSTGWQYYNYGPIAIDDEFSFVDHVALVFDDIHWQEVELYIDEIIIREVQANVYAIKGSWQTPYSCDNPLGDPFGFICGGTQERPQRCVGPDEYLQNDVPEMVGCRAYYDLANTVHSLRSFDSLCRAEVAGCQAMIDTKNTDSPFSETHNYGDPSATVIPADEFIYLVPKAIMSCPGSEKGCTRLGRPIIDQEDKASEYADVYYKNDPNQYGEIMCLSSEVGCNAYSTGDGESYFKDPGDKLCLYKEATGSKEEGWYKKDSTEDSPDCPTLIDPKYRTVGDSRGVKQPVGTCIGGNSYYPHNNCFSDSDCYGSYAFCSNWVGVCPAAESACTEFVDPVSDFSANIVYNSNFVYDADEDSQPDGWNSVALDVHEQSIHLDHNTLYVIALEGPRATQFSLECDSYDLAAIESSTNIACTGYDVDVDGVIDYYAAPCTLTVDKGSTAPAYARIYNTNNDNCRITIDDTVYAEGFVDLSGENQVAVRKAVINYNLDSGVDYSSCNGVKNFYEGCVLLNRRGVDGLLKHEPLLFSSYLTGDGQVPVACQGTVCDSNVLVKSRPDRVCDKWLFCETQEKRVDATGQQHDYCTDLGVCNSLNEKMECNGFVFNDPGTEQEFDPASVEKLQDLSGYSRVGYEWAPGVGTSGYYTLDQILERGAITPDFNGSFEVVEGEFDPNTKPFGWNFGPGEVVGDAYAIVDDPAEAQRCEIITGKGECMETNFIPPDGKNFLRINSSTEAFVNKNSLIKVYPNTTYVISGYINTQKFTSEGEGQAIIALQPYNEDRQPIGDRYIPEAHLSPNYDWTRINYSYTTDANTRAMQLILEGVIQDVRVDGTVQYFHCGLDRDSVSCSGKLYFDKVEMKPVLNVAPDEYIARSCRLYSKVDSLACEYLDDSGVMYRGWYGYCYEHDPHNANYCLQWWPLDLIKGGNPMEDEGLRIAGPVYHCLQLDFDETDREAPLLPVAEFEVGIDMHNPGDLNFWTLSSPIDITGKDWLEPLHYMDLGSGYFTELESDILSDGTADFTGRMCYPFDDDISGDHYAIAHDADGDDGYAEILINNSFPGPSGYEWPPITREYDDPGGKCDGLGNCTLVMADLQTALRGLMYLNYADYRDYYWWRNDGGGGCGDDDEPLCNCMGGCFGDEDVDLDNIIDYAEGPFLDIIAYKRRYTPDMADGICSNDSNSDVQCTNPEGSGDRQCDSHSSYNKIYFGKRAPYCQVFAQTVTPGGTNKAWANRTATGSPYVDPVLGYTADTRYGTFGAMLPPSDKETSPENWDKIYYLDERALFFEEDLQAEDQFDMIQLSPVPSDYERAGTPYGCNGSPTGLPPLANPYNAPFYIDDEITTWIPGPLPILDKFDHDELSCFYLSDQRFTDTQFSSAAINKGLIQAEDRLKRLFAENYGLYMWDPDDEKYKSIYDPDPFASVIYAWHPPEVYCDRNFDVVVDDVRVDPETYCAIPPRINNILVNGTNDRHIVLENGYGHVNLSFNVSLDPEQIPLTRIVVDWGDGTQTDLADLSMLDRRDADNPIELSHYYYFKTFEGQNPDAYQPIPVDDYHIAGSAESLANCDGKTCFSFQPRIRVWDNWEWCSGNGTTLTYADQGEYGNNCGPASFDSPDWRPFTHYDDINDYLQVWVEEP